LYIYRACFSESFSKQLLQLVTWFLSTIV